MRKMRVNCLLVNVRVSDPSIYLLSTEPGGNLNFAPDGNAQYEQ
jgi:hypothetical protein